MAASQDEETSDQSQKLYTCEHCQMTFLRPVHLERHMRNVHSQERESECKVCHKLFQNKYYLSVHMLTHAMDKELECPLCKKRFQDVNSLNKHKDFHLGLNNNSPYKAGANPQANNQIGAARNVVNPAASTAPPVPTTSAYTPANRGNTLNCDLRLTDLNSLNQSTPQNYRARPPPPPPPAHNAMRMQAPNKNSTVSCDLRLGDINSLNRNPAHANATSSMRLPQKRPLEDHDVIVTGISSLKRPFRGQAQGQPGANASRHPAPVYGNPRLPTANRPPPTNLPPQLSSRNSFLQNQLRAQNPMAAQRPPANNSIINRNITDRIYLTSEGGVSSQSAVRNSLPARISYSNRKQLANHLTQNNRFGNHNIYSNQLSSQRNQLLRNSNQANQRSVVNCDLTRGNLGVAINRRTGLPYTNAAGQQFSNGTKETDSTVNCDLTISNISSLSKNQWPTNSHANSHSAPVRNYGPATRPVSTVNFDLTTADINVLKRNRRLRQANRAVLGPQASAVGQASSTLNCDLSVANLATMEKNRHALNNGGNRFGRLNPNMIAPTSQNSQQAQNTVNCDLTTNNLHDWNRRNTICYRANNQPTLGQNRQPTLGQNRQPTLGQNRQPILGQNRQPTRTLNCNLTNVNLSSLNQRAVNNMVGAQPNQPPQVRPVQVYANSAALQRQKNAVALGNGNNSFGVRGPNNVLRGRGLPRRPGGFGPPASALSSINRSRMARMIRQRKSLAAASSVPVIDLDPEVSMVSKSALARPPQPPNATNIVQFDLTGPDVNVTTYENGGASFSGKKPSGNLVDIVELGTNKNARSQPVINNSNSVVEFDLSNTSIQAFSTGQNERPSTCTINLDGDNWTSNPRNITRVNNAPSDVTLLEVRRRNNQAEAARRSAPAISNVRSLSTLRPPTAVDDRTSGITLVDIRSLSTTEIPNNSRPQTSSERGPQIVPHNFSSVRSLPSPALADSRSTDDLPQPTVVMDTVTVALENAEAQVVPETAGTSADDDNVELKEDYFTCKTCLEQIHHLCNYISHLKSHDSKEFCKCYYCDSVFGNIQELVVHSVAHVGDLKKQCVFCREVLASGEDPITHMTGCGEFQCIMFESGSRVKIEKTADQEGEAESVAQSEKTESVAQNEKTESVAQKEKTESVAQNEKAENVAQSQVDEDGEAKSVAQNPDEATESVAPDQLWVAEKVGQLNPKELGQQRDQTEVMQERKGGNSAENDDGEETEVEDQGEEGEEMTKDEVSGEREGGNKGGGGGEETKEAKSLSLDKAEKSDKEGTELSDKKEAEKSGAGSSDKKEAEKSDRDKAEMVNEEKAKEMKTEVKYHILANDNVHRTADEIIQKLAEEDEKKKRSEEENKIEDESYESSIDIEQENTPKSEGEDWEPPEPESSKKADLESPGLTEGETDNAKDSNETEKTGDKKDDTTPTTWCEWEKNIVIKAERRERLVRKVAVKIKKLDLNEIKKDIKKSSKKGNR